MNQEDYQKQLELQRQIEALENLAKQYLTKEAITRFGTIKTAHPELALKVASLIAQAAQQANIKEKITDEQFKEILRNLQQPQRKTIIKR